MDKFVFVKQEKKIERTHSVVGIVADAVGYKTNEGNLSGIAFTLANGHKLRILTKELPAKFLGAEVEFTGVIREYDGRPVFDAKDVTIIKMSTLGKLAMAGIAYAGEI